MAMLPVKIDAGQGKGQKPGKESRNSRIALTSLASVAVIMFWRGLWTLGDRFIGSSLEGNLVSVLLSASVIVLYRVYNVPLLDTMPTG